MPGTQHADLTTETLDYAVGGAKGRAFVAYPAVDGPAPVVMVAHAWAGQTDFERERARELAGLGYVGFAIDLYGEGKNGGSTEENAALMQPFIDDRARVREGMLASLAAARGLGARVDPARVAAIGFCFGGLCVLDLARAGADVAGVVSFHGLLMPSGLEAKAISARVLALHGNDDPMVKVEQANAFGREMSEAGVDWQLHVYGGTKHAFTNPQANDHALGLVHEARSAARAFASMRGFLAELFDSRD